MANDYSLDKIEVLGAREHNLKSIDVSIPSNQLVIITGLSGSGKSSLAFDTIYAEGQRRYIETFSSYARQFLGNLERPDVDKINGLSPVIAIEQKTTSKNPRSTVGTITEIYDFLRLLYARAADAYSFETGKKMISYTDEQILDLIREDFLGKKIALLSPIVRSRKGHYRDLFEQLIKNGFLRVRIDGEIRELISGMKLDRYKTHDIELVIDRLVVDEVSFKRLKESLQVAMKYGKDVMMVMDWANHDIRYFSRSLMCPDTGIAYSTPEPNSFSFNSPKGACSKCNGLGQVEEVHMGKVIPDETKSIENGAIAPVGSFKRNWMFSQLEVISKKYKFSLTDPWSKIPEDAKQVILFGSNEHFTIHNENLGITQDYKLSFEGVIAFIENQYKDAGSASIKRWAKDFMLSEKCNECGGARLKKESLHFKLNDRHIGQLSAMDLDELDKEMDSIPKFLTEKQNLIATPILKELKTRLSFLLDVGLNYLSLDRSSKTLSGGEAQRIRLATQIGSQLVGVLYILDEPSIGLHQKDNTKLISSLKHLRDLGNSVLVVEHDKEMMEEADHIIDMGPGAGKRGGEVVAQGTLTDILKSSTDTAVYLNGEKEIPGSHHRKGNGLTMSLYGATGNNLKNVDLHIPLGKMVCVSGVSGSGKSTLINETLYPILNHHIYRAVKVPMPYDRLEGLDYIDKIIDIDQTPIGRTPRSNPATYTGVLGDIRKLYSDLPEAKIRGYKPGRFSFNVAGGRCETCQGGGLKLIEMNFLPDVYVHCETCNGKRFNRETLEVRYKGKSISEVLDMSVNEAVDFFEHIPKIFRKIKTLQDVGLGYITLGQQSTTLSGGEAQRVKLATELSKRDTGKTLFILDEPTTGLHFEDIRVLMGVLQKLVDKGNTVLIIEHNLDVIKAADHIIDLGPDGGKNGGMIICEGTPEEIIKDPQSHTAVYLKKEM